MLYNYRYIQLGGIKLADSRLFSKSAVLHQEDENDSDSSDALRERAPDLKDGVNNKFELSYEDKLLVKVLHEKMEEENIQHLVDKKEADRNSTPRDLSLRDDPKPHNSDSIYQRFIFQKRGLDVSPFPSEDDNTEAHVKLYALDLELKKAAGIIESKLPDQNLVDQGALPPKTANTVSTSDISSKPLDKKSTIDSVPEEQECEPMPFDDFDL